MNATKSADALTISLIPFRDSLQNLVRKHRSLIDLMTREKYSQEAINHQNDLHEIEIRNLRIQATSAFQDSLSIIIRDNRR